MNLVLFHPVRTSSMSTFDSIELGRFSDDSNRDADDRVAGAYVVAGGAVLCVYVYTCMHAIFL